jgi:isoleucyl-tRNA synthetase
MHKHFVDEITFPCSCGATMRRIPEVLDCWFESGAMPYAQNHYPFENREHFEANFPADFISEGLDQTRGWFYTLTVLAAALFDKPAFTHCIVNGLVLAEDGKKMSKSARNFPDPMEVMNEFGADALRLFLMHSACVKAEDLRYSDTGVKEVLKNVIIPLWNSYSFFVTYANIDKVRPEQAPENPENPIDRWILSETQGLVQQVSEQLDLYDLQKGINPIVEFIDLLNNWYIRRSRRRFWRPESKNDVDKRQAYETLYSVLITLVQVAAPFIPFITEEIYGNLKAKGLPESVHLTDFPVYDPGRRDVELEQKMKLTRQAVSMGRALRTLHNLKIRQPLKALHLVTKDQQEKRILIEMEDLIKDELNVRSVVFRENEEELVVYTAKPNYRVLGKQLGKDMKAAAARIEGLSMREIQSLLEGATLSMEIGRGDTALRVFDLTEEGVIIARTEKENLKVLNEGSLTVALDPELSDELIQEGMARDLVRGIQNLRKEMDLEVTDRIELFLFGSQRVKEAVEANEGSLKYDTLAVSWQWKKHDRAVEIECGQEKCLVYLKKTSGPASP